MSAPPGRPTLSWTTFFAVVVPFLVIVALVVRAMQ